MGIYFILYFKFHYYQYLYYCSDRPRLAIWQRLRHCFVAGDTSVNKTDENLSLSVAFILAGDEVKRQYTINIIGNKLYSMLERDTSLHFSFCLLPLPAVFTE